MKKKTRQIIEKILLFTPIGWFAILFLWAITDLTFKELIKEYWNE